MKKKVLFVSNDSWSLFNFRMGMMKYLRDTGRFNVVAVAPVDKYTEELKREFKFIPLKNLDRKGLNPVKDFLLILELISIFRKEKPDLSIHFSIKVNTYGSIAAKIASIKVLSIVAGLGTAFNKGFILSFIAKNLYRIGLKVPEKVFVLNSEDLNFFVRNKIVNKNKISILPGEGVNSKKYDVKICNKIPKEKDKFIFLQVSRLLVSKGVVEFVEAAKKIKEKYPFTEFYIVGGTDYGNPEAVNEEVVKRWKKRSPVHFVGEQKDVRPFLCKADIFVHPSFYKEGLSRSIMEAMAMGKPILTSDVAGCRDLVEIGKNGFIIKPRSVDSLVEGMEKFIKMDRKKLEDMGKYSRKLILEKFDEDVVNNILLKEVNSIINSR